MICFSKRKFTEVDIRKHNIFHINVSLDLITLILYCKIVEVNKCIKISYKGTSTSNTICNFIIEPVMLCL